MSAQLAPTEYDEDESFEPTPSRLIPQRIERVWQMVAYIAANPGETRGMLARKFHVGERQLQADLNLIKWGMGLPLERRQGYRMVEREVACTLSQADLCDAVVAVLPVHLRALAALAAHWGDAAIFRAIVDGLCLGKYVHIKFTLPACHELLDQVVKPQALIPYQGHWHLLGQRWVRGESRLVLLPLEAVQSAWATEVQWCR